MIVCGPIARVGLGEARLPARQRDRAQDGRAVVEGDVPRGNAESSAPGATMAVIVNACPKADVPDDAEEASWTEVVPTMLPMAE